MKILVSVGTGSFESLIEVMDSFDTSGGIDISFQIGDGTYSPKCRSFRFRNNLKFSDYDLIITHCGAGTIYYLLENKLSFIGVPNLDRVDDHQLDLARYVDMNNFGCICFDLSELHSLVKNYFSINKKFNIYIKDDFFKTDEILKI